MGARNEPKYITLVDLKEQKDLLKRLDMIENTTEAVRGAFRELMQEAAGQYFSESMTSFAGRYHAGLEEYHREFKKEKIIQNLEVSLMYSKDGSFSEAGAMGWGPKGIFKKGYFTFAKYFALESTISGYRLIPDKHAPRQKVIESPFAEGIVMGTESNLMDVVLTALVTRMPVDQVYGKVYDAQEYKKTPVSCSGGNVEMYIKNPTIIRVKNALKSYNQIYDFVKENSLSLHEAHQLVVASYKLTEVAESRKGAGEKLLSKNAKKLLLDADKIVKKLGFEIPALERKLVA